MKLSISEIPKPVITNTFKQILKQALIPNLFLVYLLILIHWALITYWVYINHESYDFKKDLLITILGGSLPVLSYNLWGVRRIIIKSYRIIHQNIVAIWLDYFSEDIAKEIIDHSNFQQDHILIKWKIYVQEKAHHTPKFIQFIVKLTLKRIGFTKELFNYIELVQNKNIQELAELINSEVSKQLILASEKVISNYLIVFLIPFNTILFIIVWFF